MEDGIALYIMFRTKAHKDLKALDNQDALRLLESIKKLVNFPDVPNKKGLQILSPHIDFVSAIIVSFLRSKTTCL